MVPEAIIIGGGKSIQEGVSLNLTNRIENKFVITANFACYHFNSTLTTFLDKDFYLGNLNPQITHQINQEHIEKLKSLPLIVGNRFTDDVKYYYPNTIPVKIYNNHHHYHQKGLHQTEFYSGSLTGIFSISLAAYLMKDSGNIYLLGFDWTNKELDNTHYYNKNEINHRGQGYTRFYSNHNPNFYFEPFLKEKNLKIYNVSLGSNITSFEKISYEQLFTKISLSKYNQTELRKNIKLML